MKSAAAGTVSGCLVWAIVFGVICSCLLPLGFGIASFTNDSPFAIRTVSPFICPKGTTGVLFSFDTTMTDDNGVSMPATGYELHCNDANGNTIKNDPIVFGAIWDGIGIAAALVLTAILGFVFAAPAGVLIGRLFRPKHAPPP